MKSTRRRFLFVFALMMAVAGFGSLHAQTGGLPPIYGTVTSIERGGGPVAGVTVSLVHPVIGRAAPAFSDQNGNYYFVNVPPESAPFYIEAYWGNQLLFRSALLYVGTPVQFNIQLP